MASERGLLYCVGSLDSTRDPAGAREEALGVYYKIQLEPREHPESLWTRLETVRAKLADMPSPQDEGALLPT